MQCAVCRRYQEGVCLGCVRGDLCPPEMAAASPCMVLRCAATHGIPYCALDCPEFPCTLFSQGRPFCWTRDAGTGARVAHAATPASAAPRGPAYEGAALRVFCLGSFRVLRADTAITDEDWGRGGGASRKVKALLAYLIAESPAGVRRDVLTDLLWPDQTDPAKAVANLHLALYSLRRAIQPDTPPGAPSSWIRHRDGRYAFAAGDACWVDADEFESLLGRATALRRDGQDSAAATYLSLAVDLYGGEYMAGIDATYTGNDLYDWCLGRRERLRAQFITALLGLARHHLRASTSAVALQFARRAVEVDPACETAHRIAMRCLVELGRHDEAIEQYRLCTAQLARCDHRPPEARTLTLYREIAARSAR